VGRIKFCSLFSGSSGNALFLAGGGVKILIDAGLSAKRIMAALKIIGEAPDELNAILITHEHSDHIRGAGILARKLDIPIYANQKTWKAMQPLLGPLTTARQIEFTTGETFQLGSLSVKSFSTPHDAADSIGFCFNDQTKKIAVATDIGHINDTVLNNLRYSDLIVLESNHDPQMLADGPYPNYLKKRIMGKWGHLSNVAAGELAAVLAATGTSRFVLGHLSEENNRPELAYQTVARALISQGMMVGRNLQLLVALRDSVGDVINL
jgi:phosphoribosyl 1,2-cyclic phosphodiesterase